MYNTNNVGSVSKQITIRSYNLIPSIENENNLVFVSNFSILIDASSSYDEMYSNQNSKVVDTDLLFKWDCPPAFSKSIGCQSKNSKLQIQNTEYFSKLDPQV